MAAACCLLLMLIRVPFGGCCCCCSYLILPHRCCCQVDRGCNVLEFHEKPPRTQLATMSIDTHEYGFGEGARMLAA